MADSKRGISNVTDPESQASKKARAGNGAIIVRQQEVKSNAIIPSNQAPKRTSGLQAPSMLLSGHDGEVFSCKFNPSGSLIASGSFDKQILLWSVYGECENKLTITGHQNAVLQVQWSSDGNTLYSCSADKTMQAFDTETGDRLRRVRDHTAVVNSVAVQRGAPSLSVTGSDDRTVKVWDVREGKRAVHSFDTPYQNLAVEFSADGSQVFAGGIENSIRVIDLRRGEVESAIDLSGHNDTVTGLRLSPEGHHLLSTSMDNTIRMWDVRPFVSESRCVKIYDGSHHTFEKNLIKVNWSPDGKRVAAGSGDRMVYVWDSFTTKLLYQLPGHRGCVNEVDFHPTEPIVVSGASDKNLFLGELL